MNWLINAADAPWQCYQGNDWVWESPRVESTDFRRLLRSKIEDQLPIFVGPPRGRFFCTHSTWVRSRAVCSSPDIASELLASSSPQDAIRPGRHRCTARNCNVSVKTSPTFTSAAEPVGRAAAQGSRYLHSPFQKLMQMYAFRSRVHPDRPVCTLFAGQAMHAFMRWTRHGTCAGCRRGNDRVRLTSVVSFRFGPCFPAIPVIAWLGLLLAAPRALECYRVSWTSPMAVRSCTVSRA